jgi:hypothetical protein
MLGVEGYLFLLLLLLFSTYKRSTGVSHQDGHWVREGGLLVPAAICVCSCKEALLPSFEGVAGSQGNR